MRERVWKCREGVAPVDHRLDANGIDRSHEVFGRAAMADKNPANENLLEQ